MSLDLSESSFTSLPGGCEAVEGAGRAQSEDLLSGLWEAGRALLARMLGR